MRCNFFQGITTHKNSFDFVTIDPVEIMTLRRFEACRSKLFEWIKGWKV